jgi:hypothetical protein
VTQLRSTMAPDAPTNEEKNPKIDDFADGN